MKGKWGLVLLAASSVVQAQSFLGDLGGSTTREKMFLAVYDLPDANIDTAVVEQIALDAMRLYARNARVQHGLPAAALPAYPAQIKVERTPGGGQKASCDGEVFSLEGLDTSMSGYGEGTYHRACLFPYAGGYRLNYFAAHSAQSGAGNQNPNVLAAMLGRAMASAVGIGDTSSFVNKIFGRIEEGLGKQSMPYRLVQLHPKTLEGRVVVTDTLVRPSAPAVAAPAAVPTPAVMPAAVVVPQNMPPELRAMQQALQPRYANSVTTSAPATAKPVDSSTAAISARKELHAMGLQYFSQDQFVAAVKRGDQLAVNLFVTAAGVDLNAPSNGVRPLGLAESAGHSAVAEMLRTAGAK
ncbi:MAG: hypothetical protein L6Q40_00050 [Azonexus sp.]|nr:hypothetical protein [Azonexus sp.]